MNEKWGIPDYTLDDCLAEHLLALSQRVEVDHFPVAAGERATTGPQVRSLLAGDTRACDDPAATGGPARWSDSAESWDAAPSVQEKHRVRHFVLGILYERGPLSDEALTDLAVAAHVVPGPSSSPRSRRAELVREGLVVCVDKQGLTRSKKRCARWALTQTRGNVA